jgi:hypothetical protein
MGKHGPIVSLSGELSAQIVVIKNSYAGGLRFRRLLRIKSKQKCTIFAGF